MNKIFPSFLCAAALAFSPFAFAEEETAPVSDSAAEKTSAETTESDAELMPDVALKNMIDHILAELKSNPSYRESPEKLKIFVETQISPHINFRRMTALAVGRDWRKATEEEKLRLTELFSALLIRTYSNALSSYGSSAQKIVYKPLKMQPTDTEATVKMQLQRPGEKLVDFDTRMEKHEDGWRIFDVAVAGISLVTNYREQFNQIYRQGGFTALINYLVENQNKPVEPEKTSAQNDKKGGDKKGSDKKGGDKKGGKK